MLFLNDDYSEHAMHMCGVNYRSYVHAAPGKVADQLDSQNKHIDAW